MVQLLCQKNSIQFYEIEEGTATQEDTQLEYSFEERIQNIEFQQKFLFVQTENHRLHIVQADVDAYNRPFVSLEASNIDDVKILPTSLSDQFLLVTISLADQHLSYDTVGLSLGY